MKTKSKTNLRSLIDQINGQAPTFNGSIRAMAKAEDQPDDADKKFELSFSSEDPYERWFGIEILGHKSDEVDMEWINSGNAPLLLQHNHDQQIGVIESAKLEGGRGTAVVRFGSGALAQEIRKDVEDGIRTNVSVGYRVHEMQLVEVKSDGLEVYRCTRWSPYENSIVSMPADQSVGTNRSAPELKPKIQIKENSMNLKQKAAELGLSEDATPETIIAAAEKASALAGSQKAEAKAKAELARRDTITSFAKQHGLEAAGKEFIDSRKSADEFNKYVLSKYADGHSPLAQLSDFSKSEQKDLSGFSLLRAVSMLANGQKLDGVEADVASMGITEAGQCGVTASRGNSIMVPSMLIRATAMSSAANAGGEFIPTLTSPNVIDTLRNAMVIGRIGGKVMTGLAGNLKLPKVTTSPVGASAAEIGALTDGTIVTGEIDLSPHRIGATLPYSNQLFLQSSPDVNSFLIDQLLKACALRADYLMLNGDGSSDGQWTGLFNYSGVGSVDSGVNGKNPTMADMIGLETEVAADNADVDNLRYLTSARGRGALKVIPRVASTDSRMIWEENMVNGYGAEVSNQVLSNVTKGTETTNTTSVAFGNWNAAILGFFGGQEVVVDPYTLAKKAQTQITVNMFADGDFETIQSFAVMDGVHQD